MTDRLEITITGPLPEEDKYAVMAAAEAAAKETAQKLGAAHNLVLKAKVNAVRVSGPRKSGIVAVSDGVTTVFDIPVDVVAKREAETPLRHTATPRFNMDSAE